MLLFSTFDSSFIEKDVHILNEFSCVDHLVTSGLRTVFRLFWKTLFCDVVFCWFASVHSGVAVLVARLLGKQTVVVLGGADVAAEREIGYGIWLTRWKRPFVRLAIRGAHTVLVVDPSLGLKARQLVNYDGRNIRYLPTGYDGTVWYPSGQKERMVLTVACSRNVVQARKKGIDFLCRAAAEMPDVGFAVIGVDEGVVEDAGISVPNNVTLLPAVPQEALLAHYQRAVVYCQPSRSEGLPNALCEAMLCECIPVGTAVDGIPTGIGDTGFLIPLGDVEALIGALRKALEVDSVRGRRARERIIAEFPVQRRRDGLKKVIVGLPCD